VYLREPAGQLSYGSGNTYGSSAQWTLTRRGANVAGSSQASRLTAYWYTADELFVEVRPVNSRHHSSELALWTRPSGSSGW
jgi:hypothetical protein